MQYISYMIPVSLLLLRGRKMDRWGPFRLGGWGWVANGVLVGWSVFTLVFYSFPFVKPVTAVNMSTFPLTPPQRTHPLYTDREWHRLRHGCHGHHPHVRRRVLVRSGQEDI